MSDKVQAAGFDLSAGVPAIEGDMRPKPKFADRISKRVLGVGFVFIGVLVAIFLISLNNMDKKPAKKKAEEKLLTAKGPASQEVGVPKDLLGAGAMDASSGPQTATLVKPESPVLPAQAASVPAPGVPPTKTSATAMVPPLGSSGQIPEAQPAPVRVIPPTPEQLAEKQAKQDRLTRMAAAKASGLVAKPFDSGAQEPTAAPGIADVIKEAARNAGMMGALANGGATAPKQPGSEQDEKMDFLKDAGKEDRGYHPHIARPALSANEVKTGTYIPMALEQGINSDLPGQITARVTEAVYDSVSGCRMLIPAMAKVVGRYDSKVALGQGRMLVVWNSMIFPDGAELNLAGMQGYDTAGQAGLKSDVDNHYLRLIGLSFGMSMITAGVQLSIPQPNTTSNGAAAPQTPSQIIAASLSQQYGQLGAQLISKYMAVQPTLRNFPGERFMLMVPHTVVFQKVWRNRCSG